MFELFKKLLGFAMVLVPVNFVEALGPTGATVITGIGGVVLHQAEKWARKRGIGVD